MQAIIVINMLIKATPLKTWSEMLKNSRGGGRHNIGVVSAPQKMFVSLAGLNNLLSNMCSSENDKSVYWELTSVVSTIIVGGGGGDGQVSKER